jgi:hypothetical protein
MTEEQSTKTETPLDYIHRAVVLLSDAWMRPYPNRSGMRAAFRRWRPSISHDPQHMMRDYIWSWLGAPGGNGQDGKQEGISLRDQEIIDQAAVLVALRAIAGDKPPTHRSFGAALKAAELSDLRLMRLLTTPQSLRFEALYRALRLLDREGVGFSWKGREGRHEVNRMVNFLFRSTEAAQQSANQWAADFFASRGKIASDIESTTQQSNSTSQE